MFLAAVIKRVLPFSAAFLTGLIVSHVLAESSQPVGDLEVIPVVEEAGSGFAACSSNREIVYPQNPVKGSLKIISKPRPGYTDEARKNNVQGTVVLEVTFLASGGIGLVKPITNLPDGLTEKSIEAANRIKFEPPRVNGRPNSVIKKVEYIFTIY